MMFDSLKQKLLEDGILVHENVELHEFTTFHIGGPCPLFVKCETASQLQKIVRIFYQCDTAFIIIGRGSNVLIADEGIALPVVYFLSEKPAIKRAGNRIIVSSGTRFDDAAAFAAENGLKGLNYASGIPGTVGGAVVGNAGAFGSQISDVIKQVEVVSREDRPLLLSRYDIKFSYRDSIFKQNDLVLLSVHFELQTGDREYLLGEREDILTLRKEKHPDYHTTPCAGSFFKNIVHPDGTREAAGWFLDRAGCKGLSYGDAVVFDKHANIIINNGHASAQDVSKLASMMNARVKEKFDFELEPEVRLLGIF